MTQRTLRGAWVERWSGPGWTNIVLWYVYWDGTTERVKAIQALEPEALAEVGELLDIAEAVNKQLLAGVERILRKVEQ